MPLETATTIAGLNALWPLGTDSKGQGDDHIRMIKSVLQTDPILAAASTAQARNRIVNGAMQISQEFGTATNGPSGTFSAHQADQWLVWVGVAPGAASAAQVQAVTPNGSRYRVGLTVNTAKAALAAGDLLYWQQAIEGIRVADFGWGTAQAKQAILRFGFKGPAGTYAVSIVNGAAANRTYIATFTISAGQANTDTTQTLVIPGDTTGTWATDNTSALQVCFTLAAGMNFHGVAGWQAGNLRATAACTNGLASTSNIFNIFDVGLYLDPLATGVAPAWVMPDEAQELAACQRYYQQIPGISLNANIWYGMPLRPVMRTTPAQSNSGGLTSVTVSNQAVTYLYSPGTGTTNWTFSARM